MRLRLKDCIHTERVHAFQAGVSWEKCDLDAGFDRDDLVPLFPRAPAPTVQTMLLHKVLSKESSLVV